MLSPALLATAAQEIQDTGSISRQTLAAILELSDHTMTGEQMNRTRPALDMLIRDFEAIRQFKMPRASSLQLAFGRAEPVSVGRRFVHSWRSSSGTRHSDER